MHVARLHAISGELRALGCQVVVVAQGIRESGLQWKKDYGFTCQLLIDHDMVFYRQFGLRREVKLVWTLETFNFYAANVIEGRGDNLSYDGDDLTVMGGDFIVDKTGNVVFAHVQSGQFDRPPVEDILKCIKKL